VVPARRSLASVIALPVSSRSPRGEGIAPREDDSPSRCPRRLGDADPPGVRAAWSPGALTGQRRSAGVAAARPGVEGVVLVGRGCLAAAGRALTRQGRRCICRTPRALSGLVWSPL
jgi:hypothetical protein